MERLTDMWHAVTAKATLGSGPTCSPDLVRVRSRSKRGGVSISVWTCWVAAVERTRPNVVRKRWSATTRSATSPGAFLRTTFGFEWLCMLVCQTHDVICDALHAVEACNDDGTTVLGTNTRKHVTKIAQ
eukprot:643015-Prymnesium_polylepis.1